MVPYVNRTSDILLSDQLDIHQVNVREVIDEFRSQTNDFKEMFEAFVYMAPGRFRVNCKNAGKLEVAENFGYAVRGLPVTFKAVSLYKWVNISRLSYGILDDAISTASAPYGAIKLIKSEQYSNVYTGVRNVLMEVKHEIPARLRIAGHWCGIYYKGQKRLCFTCRQEGHFTNKCPSRNVESVPPASTVISNIEEQNCNESSVVAAATEQEAMIEEVPVIESAVDPIVDPVQTAQPVIDSGSVPKVPSTKKKKLKKISLRSAENCLTLFSWLNCVKADFICLQETHSTSAAEFLSWVKAESEMSNNLQNYSVLSLPGSLRSSGVAILFRPTFKLVSSHIGNNGRVIIAQFSDISGDPAPFQITNIYGPNRKQLGEEFFEEILPLMDPSLPTVLCGDFNTVPDANLDRVGCNTDSYWSYSWPLSLSLLTQGMDLVDVWRQQHPFVREYTWRRPNGQQASRLDMFWISSWLLTHVQEVTILPFSVQDRFLILVGIGNLFFGGRFVNIFVNF